MFSVIVPSFLGDYRGAAKNREAAFVRMLQSLDNQTFKEFETIVVADGCKRTTELCPEAIYIDKEPLWSPVVRNTGITRAKSDYIIYLDTDDYYGPNHLETVHVGLHMKGYPPWAWFNDLTINPARTHFVERHCDINTRFKHGTSNLVHRRDLGVMWPQGSYLHDLYFADELKRHAPPVQIPTPEYCVGHIPNLYEV